MTDKKLFLIDAYALIYKAYFAFIKNPMRNNQGLNTSPMFVFTNTIFEIIEKEKPSHLAVAFDPGGLNFRHELFKEYKANRPLTPEDIKIAVPHIKNIIKAFNIPIVQIEGYEADDVIGSLSKQGESKGYEVSMLTPDKDYCQLVTEKVKLHKPGRSGNKNEIWGIEEVNKKFQIQDPKQVIDVLALWGDSSDNIPGAPGIGEKTAKKLIAKYGSVENIYEHIDELKGKQKENMLEFKEQIMLSKTLVTIVTDFETNANVDDFELKEPNKESLLKLFQEFNFKNLANKISPQKKPTQNLIQGSLFDTIEETNTNISSKENIKTIAHQYFIAEKDEEIAQLLDLLSNAQEFCFDTETTSLNTFTAELVGISFSVKPKEAHYIPIPANKEKANEIVQRLKPLLEEGTQLKIGQNLKYDILVLKQYGVEVAGPFFDTMIAHYLIAPEERHNMDYLAEKYLNYEPVHIEELIGPKGKKQGTMRNVPVDKIKEYAGEDADITLQLKHKLSPILAQNKLEKLFTDIECPLMPILAKMEHNGIKVDKAILENYSLEIKEKILALKTEIIEMAGTEFNLNSTKQLGEVLFDKMKIIDNPKKTKTKQYSTNEKDLHKIQDKHPIIIKILEYRGLNKLQSTYIEGLIKLINPATGKLHTSFNQTITATGRLSSTNPNLQNIPIRTNDGKKIRKAFIPLGEDSVLLSADYSQIELRIFCHLSEDANMIEAFKQGQDIHAATAAKIFNVPIEEVTREMRSKAKSANFGIVYGISAFGLAENLQISRSEAKELIDGYFASYPKVQEYMNKSIEYARQNNSVKTIMGRKRSLPDIASRNSIVKGYAERNAINSPIQGSAADIIKLAMIKIQEQLTNRELKTQMLVQVHDELIFDVPNNELDTVKEMIKKEMEQVMELSIPLVVDMGTGKNWLEAH